MKNKTALITGASSGIGLELAKILASKGNDLVLVARRLDKLEDLKKTLESQYNINALCISQDLALDNAAQVVYDQVKDANTEVDYLINNAGFGDYGDYATTKWENEDGMIQVNIKALTHFCKLFVPDMIRNGGGKIMNVASVAAFQPGPTMAVYFATKAYVLHYSEAINNELSPKGVTVTALCPGATQSEFFDVADMHENNLVKDKKLPSAAAVAIYGYQSMMRGKAVAIHGLKNRILVASSRFTPRSLVVKVSRMMMN